MQGGNQSSSLLPSKDCLWDIPPWDVVAKAAVAKASPCIVSIVSHNLPDEMTYQNRGLRMLKPLNDNREYVFTGSGTIVECESVGGGKFEITVLTCANLFVRTNGVQPNQIKVDVLLSGGELYEGDVVACDFHYNLAVVKFLSDCLLQTAVLRALDDILSIDPNEHLRLCEESSFQLRRHSDFFKIGPGTKIMAVGRSFEGRCSLSVGVGVFCFHIKYSKFDCNELYCIKDISLQGDAGGPVINSFGEVIGIFLDDTAFLPSNIVLRWWQHYKTQRDFRRPWLGVEHVNLHEACLDFLEEFVTKFSNVHAGVVVTKVREDSVAYKSGIRPGDVIVECNNKPVQSILELFEKVWENAGKCVEISVVRASDGSQFKASVPIEDTTPDKFYRWQLLSWYTLQRSL